MQNICNTLHTVQFKAKKSYNDSEHIFEIRSQNFQKESN